MISKNKSNYIKAKSNDRVKTLESFCKYDQNRINQPKYEQNYKLSRNYDYPYQNDQLTWTDKKVQQIKKKYDIPKVKQDTLKGRHTRNYTTVENFRSKPRQRQPLRQKSYSNVLKQSRDKSLSINKDRNQYQSASSFYQKNHQQLRKSQIVIQQSQIRHNQIKLENNHHHRERKDLKADFYADQNLDMSYARKIPQVFKSVDDPINIIGRKNRNYKEMISSNLDPRIENINKINLKIKSALQNFNNYNPKTKSKTQQLSEYSYYSIKQVRQKSPLQNESRLYQHYQTNRIIQARPINSSINTNVPNRVDQITTRNVTKRYNSNINQNVSRIYNEQQVSRINLIKNKQIHSIHPIHPIHSIHPRQICLNDNFIAQQIGIHAIIKNDDLIAKQVDFKNTTGKINHLTNKIQELQRQKRLLNIQFKPFSQKKPQVKAHQRSYSTVNVQKSHIHSLTPQKADRLSSIRNKYSNKQYQQKPIINQSTIKYFNSYMGKSSVKDFKEDKQNGNLNQLASNIANKYKSPVKIQKNSVSLYKKYVSPIKNKFQLIDIKQNRSESYEGDQQHVVQQNDTINQNKYQSMKFKYNQDNTKNSLKQFIKLTQSGIQMRKKTKQSFYDKNLTHNTNQRQNYFVQFQQILTKQIQLDTLFRKAKLWFTYCKDSNKWQNLQRKIKSLNINSTQINLIKDLRINFQITDEQIDPFFSISNENFTYDQLANIYLNSQQNFISKVVNNQIINQLIVKKWIQTVDRQRKGFVLLSDLSSFMNLNSQFFYKNRDLALIFNRLTRNFQNQSRSNNRVLTEECLKGFMSH